MIEKNKTSNRVVSEWKSRQSRFYVKEKFFDKQYYHFYSARLNALKKNLSEGARDKWGSSVQLCQVSEIKAGEECVVIGTLFKHMELQPSVLKELSEEHELGLLETAREKYASKEDQLYMEDNIQRIALSGAIKPGEYVTGVVMAVRGVEKEEDPGVFVVSDWCTPQLTAAPYYEPLLEDRYVMFVSGLGFGCKRDNSMSRDLLAEYLLGNLEDDQNLPEASKITRVIMAGNSLHKDTEDKSSITKAKYLTKNLMAGTVWATKELDSYLSCISNAIEVDLMPGEFDTANYQLPQQPLHSCVLPQALRRGTVSPTTNPYECSIEGIRFLGTSGQPVTNISQYSDWDNPVSILEKTLQWAHLAPTCPDTLGAYPFKEGDPFIIEECPHVYFAGNQKEFGFRMCTDESSGQSVALLSVPSFHESHSAVVLNLRTLTAQLVSFECGLPTELTDDDASSEDCALAQGSAPEDTDL